MRHAGGHQLAGLLDEHERRVALVEVPGRRLDAQGSQRAHAADAQDQLLVQPHLAAAHVQDVGDRPVVSRRCRACRCRAAAAARGRPAPARRRPWTVATRELDRDEQRVAARRRRRAERQAARVVVGVGVLLVAVGVDGLAEVAVAIEQADADERQRHVRGGLAVVAGEHAQAARVDAQRLVEAELGAEVGDGPVELVAVVALEPVAAAVRPCTRRSAASRVVYSTMKSASSRMARPVALGLEDGHRVAVALPRRRSMRLKSARTSGCHVQ